MLDVGMVPGVQSLWQQDQLCDYTISVQQQEFRVHKVIMASVSEYFRTMLCGGLMESKTDRVELKGLSAEGVSELIKLVYTGQEEILHENLAELLACSIYFQMPTIINLAKKKLLDDLKYGNSFYTLSLFMTYSLQDGVDKVKEFIKEYWFSIMKEAKPEDISHDVFSVIFDCWDKREWDLFLFIKNWVEADPENNKQHINNLMCKVRFCLMTLEEVAALKVSDMFKNSDGSWHDLLNQAVGYHNLPAHMKIYSDKSFQTEFRGGPVPVFFNTGKMDSHSIFYAFEDNGCNIRWGKRKALKSPKFTDPVPIAIEVFNNLVVCTECKKGQNWFIFDPQSMTWSEMAAMTTAKTKFALVHHSQYLYVLGGDYGLTYDEEMVTGDVERYSFRTNKWDTIKKMPNPVKQHTACVVGDVIYVCGGRGKKQSKRGDEASLIKPLANLDCMNINTGVWEKKAAMKKAKEDHVMQLMTLHSKETIVVIDHSFKLDFYSPESNQWFDFELSFNNDLNDLEWKKDSMILTNRNTIYILNVRGIRRWEDPDDDDDFESMDSMDYILWGRSRERYGYESDTEEDEACVRWEIQDNGVVKEVIMSDFPVKKSCIPRGSMPFSCVLSVSPAVDKKLTDLS